jgi:hypothetical protein
VPVHNAQKNGVLVITVDGDYTAAELRRVGAAAVADLDAPARARILLDVSGAAGLARRPPAELIEVADFFASLGDTLHAVAVLAPDDASYGLMRMGMELYAGGGMRAEVFRDRPGALGWLNAEASS